ncbi:uncharacterized protein MCAP_0864-like [Chironomus tepperi]|uniref:uncharacterized protein MCAP_0864-like n=1 Tax=Chironomus tepperi TaxID=113505 RepID=UPI00391EE98E
MSQIQNLKEGVLKRLEAEKNDLKADIKKKLDLIIESISLNKKKELIKLRTSETSVKNKNIEEQIDLKESEKIEYEEGDLKSSIEYLDQIKRENRKFEHQIKSKQAEIINMCSQSEAIISQLLKYKKKLDEIPAIKQADRIKAETILENKTFKLNAVRQAIKDSNEQEANSMSKIAQIEIKSNKILAKSEELADLINAKRTLADKIVQYQNQIIPEIANEIEKIKMNIVNVEDIIEEKKVSKNNATKEYDDLYAKYQNEQEKYKALHEKLQSISKLKNDIINKKFSSKDIEGNPILKKLALTKQCKKQLERIHKLTKDKSQISKDSQTAKNNKDESVKALKKLKEEMKRNKELSRIKKDEIMSLEKDIDGKKDEIQLLNNEKLELNKVIRTNEKKKELIKSTIAELNATYKKVSKKIYLEQTRYRDSDLTESQLRAVDMNASTNNKNNVHKWLNDLPQKFTNKSIRPGILSQNSTVNLDDSKLNNGTIRHNQTNDFIKMFNLDIDDPEVIDANMECTFSDINGSEVCLEDSFLTHDLQNL